MLKDPETTTEDVIDDEAVDPELGQNVMSIMESGFGSGSTKRIVLTGKGFTLNELAGAE